MSDKPAAWSSASLPVDDNVDTTTTLDNWTQQLLDPSIVNCYFEQQQQEVGGLSQGAAAATRKYLLQQPTDIPWILERTLEPTTTTNSTRNDTATTAALSLTESTASHAEEACTGDDHYPNTRTTEDYLSLRRLQNLQFAEHCLAQGVEYARERMYDKAQECYQQGLELVPHHVDLLVAYGALLANLSHYNLAKEMLVAALNVNPHHINAKQYLAEIEQAAIARNRSSAALERSDRALRDASLEQSLAVGTSIIAPADKSQDEAYPMLDDDLTEQEEEGDDDHHHPSSRTKQRQRRRHKTSKKQRRRRRKHDSKRSDDHDDDSSTRSHSSSEDSTSRQRRRRRKHRRHEKKQHRKQQKRKRKNRSSSPPSSDSDEYASDSTKDSLCVLRKQQQRRKRQRHCRSDDDENECNDGNVPAVRSNGHEDDNLENGDVNGSISNHKPDNGDESMSD